jgi:hypothetical protein
MRGSDTASKLLSVAYATDEQIKLPRLQRQRDHPVRSRFSVFEHNHPRQIRA